MDVWSDEFAPKLAEFSSNCAEFLRSEYGEGQMYCPINEISYLAWAGADVGRMNPCVKQRGAELKPLLAKAAIMATRFVRAVDTSATFICAEPLIHVAPIKNPRAAQYREAQFEALDMLLGHRCPELGGDLDLVDLVGLNYYPDNQWFHSKSTIPMGHYAYRPLSEMLAEVHIRYGKPMFLSETGAEGRARPYWLYHVTQEIAHAIRQGVPVLGLCVYPILDYPGWEDERPCDVGLFSNADELGQRLIYAPLLEEMQRTQATLDAAWSVTRGDEANKSYV